MKVFRHKTKVKNCIKMQGIIIILTNFIISVGSQQEVWVFVMVNVSHQTALRNVEIVQQRNAATLLPIIQAHLQSDTLIHSDQWVT